MKFADRLKFTATGASAATITVVAAVANCRDLAKVIADDAGYANGIKVGDTSVPFTVDDGAGNWEDSLFTVTSATQLTRTKVFASSAGGVNPATFTGATLTVFNSPPGAMMSRVSVDSDVAFSQTVPLAQPGTAWMGQQAVSGALAFSPANGAIKGAQAVIQSLIADGTNAPTFPGFTEHGSSAGYMNTANVPNSILFWFDGYTYWYSVSQAANPVAVTPAATAITLSGPASGVVSTVSTNFTAGANGAITGTVVVTPNDGGAGGTFNPTSASLNSGSPTGTFTYTPASTGNKTISVTNNGGLANPSAITYAVSAAATAPGAPTIGTATAGDSAASFPFTAPASNGGSTISGYTLTVYKASDNSVVGTFNGTTSPIGATGLTNGVGYYGKVAATNGVGTGSQSAASNTVTPAAAVASPRLTNLVQTTESGTGPYSYVGTGGSFGGSAFGGILATHLQSGVDGSFEYVIGSLGSAGGGTGGSEAMLAINTSQTPATYTQVPYAFYTQTGTSKYVPFTSGNQQTQTNTVAPANGDRLRLRRVGSTLIAEVSKDNGSTYTIVYTWTGVSTGTLYFQVMLSGSSVTATNLTTSGLA